MSQQCSCPIHSWPLEGRCLYYALPGLTQAPGLAGGPDCQNGSFVLTVLPNEKQRTKHCKTQEENGQKDFFHFELLSFRRLQGGNRCGQ